MSKDISQTLWIFAARNNNSIMNKIKFLLSALIFGLPLCLNAQQAPGLKELIDSALARDGALEQQVLETRYTELDQEKLKDIFLPKLEISGKAGYMYTSAQLTIPGIDIPPVPPIFPGLVIPDNKNSLNISGLSASAKAEASLVLYSGGKVKYLNQALQEKSMSSKALMEKTRDDVITAVSKAYDQFALVHESKRVLDESRKRLDANKKTADKALGYGLITPYDHKKIELAQATLESKIAEYEGKKDLLITQLHLLTGIAWERIAEINPSLEVIDYQPNEEAIEQRAEIQALNHGIKASEYKIKAEEQWWQPKVQAVTSLSYFGLYKNHITTSKDLVQNFVPKLDVSPNDINVLPMFQIGVGFKWDILDGNEGKSAIERAKIDKEILESKRKDARRQLQLNLANNQNNYNISFSQIALKKKARDIAKSAVYQAEKEFRYGLKKSTDLVEAEADLETAELEYQTAVYNQRRAAIELMKSTQDLDISRL